MKILYSLIAPPRVSPPSTRIFPYSAGGWGLLVVDVAAVVAAVVVVAVVTAVVVAVVVVAEVVLLVDGLVVVEVGVKLSHPATSKHKYTVNSHTII